MRESAQEQRGENQGGCRAASTAVFKNSSLPEKCFINCSERRTDGNPRRHLHATFTPPWLVMNRKIPYLDVWVATGGGQWLDQSYWCGDTLLWKPMWWIFIPAITWNSEEIKTGGPISFVIAKTFELLSLLTIFLHRSFKSRTLVHLSKMNCSLFLTTKLTLI